MDVKLGILKSSIFALLHSSFVSVESLAESGVKDKMVSG